jgi:protease-4
METTKSGRLKDMFSSFREATPEEREKEQAILDAAYDRFVSMVASERELTPEKTRDLATGEIFTAAQAKDAGLIDELGDLDTAIDLAQSLSGLTERKVTYLRPHRSLRDRLLNGTAASLADSFVLELEARLLSRRLDYR